MGYDLEALEAMAKAATPGPWRWGSDEEGSTDWNPNTLVTVEKRERWKHGDRAEREIVVLNEGAPWDSDMASNREYIASASPEVLLALVEVARAAQRVVEAEKIPTLKEWRNEVAAANSRLEVALSLFDTAQITPA